MFRRLRRASVQIDPAELEDSDYERSGDVSSLRSPLVTSRPSSRLSSETQRSASPSSHLGGRNGYTATEGDLADSAGSSASQQTDNSDDRLSDVSIEFEEDLGEINTTPNPTTTSISNAFLMNNSIPVKNTIPEPEPIGDVPSDLKCCICLSLLDDPRTIPCEAHHMACKQCLISWLDERLNCPLDKEAIDPEMICMVPPMVSRILGSIKVRCGFHRSATSASCDSQICHWNGELSEYSAHIDRYCPCITVRCGNSSQGCTVTFPRREWDSHMSVCEYRQVSCYHCQTIKLSRDMEKHMANDCTKMPINCPNDCEGGAGILREEIDAHLKICIEQSISCVFGSACGAQLKRKELDKHIEENMALHLVLAMKKIDEDEKRMSELDSQMKEKDAMIADLTHQLKMVQPHHRVQWRITKSLRDKESFSFKSPMFDFAGCSWCLSIKRKARSREHFSVYLHKCTQPNTSLSVQFSVRAVNCQDESLSIGEETTEVFKGITAWGWSNMLEAWLLSDRRHGFLGPDGSITIEAELRQTGGLTTHITTGNGGLNSPSASLVTNGRERR